MTGIVTVRETCYHCLHADFKAEEGGAMRGYARCTKAKTAEAKSSYYFGGYQCDKGEFKPATAETMKVRREKFEKWRKR